MSTFREWVLQRWRTDVELISKTHDFAILADEVDTTIANLRNLRVAWCAGEQAFLGTGERARALRDFAIVLDMPCKCGHPLWQHVPVGQDCDEPCTACECEMYDEVVLQQVAAAE